jgi:sRNA-binding carbon storage regulator CsrA
MTLWLPENRRNPCCGNFRGEGNYTALSIGVSVGSRIDIGGHMLVVKALVAPNVVVVTIDRGEEILISEGKSVEILPGVKVQSGVGGNRLAFHAPKSIRISRIESAKGERR